MLKFKCASSYFQIKHVNEFKFNEASTHEGHLRKNGILICFDTKMVIVVMGQVYIMYMKI